MAMTLSQVVPWGRSLTEYRRMFALSDEDVAGLILGCGDGPASFNAEMTALGHRVVSADPIYALTSAQIEQRVAETYETVVAQVKRSRADYVWEMFRDEEELGRHRLATMRKFLADFSVGLAAGRYRAEALPRLSFADGAFDLAVCSHLLFLYTEQLSLAFHCESILELCRVAREVRIFPLLGLDCQKSRHIEPVQATLTSAGFTVDIVRVQYEFQRGGDEMMRIHKPAPRPLR